LYALETVTAFLALIFVKGHWVCGAGTVPAVRNYRHSSVRVQKFQSSKVCSLVGLRSRVLKVGENRGEFKLRPL
jgi:hypothetical protein